MKAGSVMKLARPEVAVLELEQAAVAAGGVGVVLVEAEPDLFAERRVALADVVAALGRERQAVELVVVVAADSERDRLRVGPLVVAEEADQPFRPLLQVVDLDDAVGDELDAGGRDRFACLGHLDQLLGEADRDRAGGDVLLDRCGQTEQAQPVVDVGGCLADPLGELLLVHPAAAEDRLEGVRFLDRVEVGAVQVLVDGQFERRVLVAVAERDRHLLQPGQLRCAVAALAGDQGVAAVVCADDERLQYAVLADRVGQLPQGALVEALARVRSLGDVDLLERDELEARRRSRSGGAH